MANNNMYNMLRDKAQSMGHAAANLPDSIWQKYLDIHNDRTNLARAKLYMENYMMGSLEPQEFAKAMAEDNILRYTISDLCRIRLAEPDLNIQRGTGYIDVGAGLKTFWTEIHVPIPSEIQAARDIRNINYGVEAAQKANGANASNQNEPDNRKRSLRDIINNAKTSAAKKAVEVLTPIAERDRTKQASNQTVQAFMESDKGVRYKNEYTYNAAQHIENMAMNIEGANAIRVMENDLKTQWAQNGKFDKEPISISDMQNSKDPLMTEDYYKNLYKLHIMQANGHETPGSGIIADETLKEWRDLLSYERKREMKPLTNSIAKQELDAGQKEPYAYQDELRSGYPKDALNRPLDSDMQVLFDQIMEHVHQDQNMQKDDQKPEAEKQASQDKDQKQEAEKQAKQAKQDQKPEAEKQASQDKDQTQDGPVRKGYVKGEFEGQTVTFKGSWSNHTFTDKEVEDLLSGKTISFNYEKNGESKQVFGKLEQQTYKGREFLGFKADFSKKQDEQQDKEQNIPHNKGQDKQESLFTESDEALMNYYMGGGTDPNGEDYQKQLNEDMERYQDEIMDDQPPELSAEDLANLFDDNSNQLALQ